MTQTIQLYAHSQPHLAERFLNAHQARRRAPTSFEDLLGDAIERGFAAGHWELDALVNYLNTSGSQSLLGKPWTSESFAALMRQDSQPDAFKNIATPYVAPALPPAPPTHTDQKSVEAVLQQGLKNLWYPICPSDFVTDKPQAMRRLGFRLAVWRETSADGSSKVHALEDHCPHRGAPLSQGVNLGDRLACPYHGIEVRCDGMVTKVPASPGCALENKRATKSFHIQEVAGAVWLYNSAEHIEAAPALTLPPELTDEVAYANFMCYAEWKGDYRYVIENVLDPMHGTFLHKQSHSMSEGDVHAKFEIRETEHGFFFEKANQRDVNFDWTEWADTGTHWMRLEIPYPKTGGPGGSFIIIGSYTPITPTLSAVFFWRVRRVQGWQSHVWQFLYRNRLEARHWAVLEQDRVMMEAMEPDANQREQLYAHDAGVVRIRRIMKEAAKKQLSA
jgi:phenylpropionate dioxygenase-like ring-hydroxylating dioxygenase large terminal subunit